MPARKGAWRIAGVWMALVSWGCDDTRPISTVVELQVQRIYDASEWLRKVPVEYAIGLYARSEVERFVGELDLPEAVATRVRARLDADDFVDELVPFLLFVRDMYRGPEGAGAETFDVHLRASFSPGERIPGIEHSLFRWKADETEKAPALPRLPPELAAQLVAFYDALYLRSNADAHSVGERLTCEGRSVESGLAAAVADTRPAIRALIRAIERGLEPGSELAGAVAAILSDEAKLEAATAALIQFIDQAVCRNYRFFATRIYRERQLSAWFRAELEKPGGGALWAYLEAANRARRYGIVVAVDGLQGKLVEALARGRGASAFVQAITSAQAAAGGIAPRARSLRPAPAQTTAFLTSFAASGFSHPHYLPFFRSVLQSENTHWLPVGVSTTPTISVRNIPIILTGAPVAGPGGTGLPNFHFVDRTYTLGGEMRGRAYYFYGSDAVDLVRLTKAGGMRTLFERLGHLGTMSCTAQYDERAHFGIDALLNLALGEYLRDFGDRLCAAELERRSRTERELAVLRQRVLESRNALVPGGARALWTRLAGAPARELALRRLDEIARLEQRTLPQLLVYYNPWPDHFAHFKGPFSDEIIAPSGELNRLDYWMGRFQRAYADAGVLDRAVFGMAGDHGLAPVFHLLNPEVEVFDGLRAEGVDFRVVKISSDEGEGPKLTNPFDPPTVKGIDVVVASTAGGNYMLDLFRDQAAGFAVQPLARDLRAVRPLGAPEAPAIDLIDEIATRLADSLDYLVVRESESGPAGGAVRVVGVRDRTQHQGLIRREGDRVHYAPGDVDLLDTDRLSPYESFSQSDRGRHRALREQCVAADVSRPDTWCREDVWTELCSYTPRPDAVVQLAHLYDSDRAGTINLFPRDGVGYNSDVPGRHAGESFHEKNALVAVWGVPLARVSPPRSAVNGAIPMLVYTYLSGERPAKGDDGWGYPPLPEALVAPDGR